MVRISWGWEQQRLVMIKSVKISTVSFWYVFYLLEALFWLLKNKQGTTILGSNKVISESSTHTCLVHFSSVAQSCPILWELMDCSTPGLPVYHQLPEFTQTHVHWVSDALQPSYHLLSISPPAINLSQHHGLFKWLTSSHQVAKVLEFQLQHQSLQ